MRKGLGLARFLILSEFHVLHTEPGGRVVVKIRINVCKALRTMLGSWWVVYHC